MKGLVAPGCLSASEYASYCIRVFQDTYHTLSGLQRRSTYCCQVCSHVCERMERKTTEVSSGATSVGQMLRNRQMG